MNLQDSFPASHIGPRTTTRRSDQPGRNSAGSRTSGRLVAATKWPFIGLGPVHFHEQLIQGLFALVMPHRRDLRAMPSTASISSMKMIQGACFLPARTDRALAMRRRRRTSRRSGTRDEEKRPLLRPRWARASGLPVPGGPTRRTPLGAAGRKTLDGNWLSLNRPGLILATSAKDYVYFQ